MLTIEPYWRNIIGSIERAERLFREVHSPALRLVMDPCNFFRKEDLPRMKPMLEAMFSAPRATRSRSPTPRTSRLRPRGPTCPPPGLGVLDYPLFLRLLAGLDRPLLLVVEHLKRAEVTRVRDFVQGQFERI